MHILAQANNNSGGAAGGLLAGGCGLIGLLIALAMVAFTIWMLIDVLSSSKPTNEKILWALVMFFTGGLGALLYFFIARGKSTPGV